MIDCNELKIEKRHECTNMGKVKRLELRWQLYGTSLTKRGVTKYLADVFLFDGVYKKKCLDSVGNHPWFVGCSAPGLAFCTVSVTPAPDANYTIVIIIIIIIIF